ncbi:MAG: hypothetical protein GWP14_08425 [Actinobacteria bacterium]|nr:hypothetical protein [Actinomycetota bacterium]
MKTTGIKILLAILCPLAILGCGDNSCSPQAPGKADTPQRALENMRSALLAGGKQAFVACFDAPAKQEEMLGALYEFSSVSTQFDEAMTKAYGQEAVKKAMGGANKGMQLQDENWLEGVTIKVDGDTATAVKEGQDDALRLIKKEGLWKINAESMLGGKVRTDEDIERAIKMFQIMAEVVTEVKQKIGQEGYTAEKINQELRQAMMMAMMRASGGPALPGR